MSHYLRSQVIRFVVLFVERTGSTYLMTTLASHPDIEALREHFAVLRQQGNDGAGQLEWAGKFFTPPLVGEHAAVGFKTKMVDILDPDGFTALLQEKQAKIIQLERRNSVKGVISTINASRLHAVAGTWNLLNENDRMPSFAVDPDEFDRLIRQREAWDQELETYVNRLALPTLRLWYEDLLLDEDAFFASVLDFLHVKPTPMQGRTLKNTSDDLREVVTNFDELRARYAGTRYAPMFDEINKA
jgi:LPS sulfotransferase NodH